MQKRFSATTTTRKSKSNPSVLEAIASQSGKSEVPDILQFACGGYYCAEGETHVEVKVERLGNPDGHASVEYYTADGSAKAGSKYKATTGVATFEPQQTESIIHVDLFEDSNFDSVLEFTVHLKNAQGAALDHYLHKCEITIVDDDTFPTNKFKDIEPGDPHGQIRETSLLIEYIRMHMQDKKLWRLSLCTVFCDQLENLELAWNLLLTRYLIDFLLNPEPKKEPLIIFKFLTELEVDLQVYVFVGMVLLPNPLKYALQLLKACRRMGGKSRMRLQENLMRKFLNYNQLSRSQMSTADLNMSISRDVPELVHHGLLMIFPILQKIGLLLMYGVLAIRNNLVTGIYFLAFPLFMFVFLRLRFAVTEQLHRELFESQTKMVAFVQKVTDFFRMIADYGQKQETVDSFHGVVANFNVCMHEYHMRRVTNFAFAPLLTNIVVAIYIIMFFRQVRDPDQSMGIGEFVAGIGIWKGVGGCYQGIYENVLTMQDALSSLHNICYYMNLPLDIVDRKEAMCGLLKELDTAQDASSALFYEGKRTECSLVQNSPYITSGDIQELAGYSQDLIQIDCHDVSFSWPSHGMTPEKVILANASFEISQGQLTGIVGSAGSGKSTLLQLLAGVLVPQHEGGLFFVPPHLRLLHVTCQPIIFHDCSLWDNLMYGEVAEADRIPQRVMKICSLMGMSQDVMNALEDSRAPPLKRSTTTLHGTGDSVANRKDAAERARSLSSIAHKDRCLLHLARALIVNPDLLIMHKPLTQFHSVDVNRVLEVFRTYVDLRGLEQPVALRQQRRPRTCIMSLTSLEGLDVFDLILQINNGRVQEVNMEGIADLKQKSKAIIKQLDSSGDGFVSRDEFISEVAKNAEIAMLFDIPVHVLEGPEAEVNLELGSAFDKLDFTGSGIISSDDLMTALQEEVKNHAPTVTLSRRASQMLNEPGANGFEKPPNEFQKCSARWEGQTPVPEEGSIMFDTFSKWLANAPDDTLGPGSRSNTQRTLE